jgi:hypothetical protein
MNVEFPLSLLSFEATLSISDGQCLHQMMVFEEDYVTLSYKPLIFKILNQKFYKSDHPPNVGLAKTRNTTQLPYECVYGSADVGEVISSN